MHYRKEDILKAEFFDFLLKYLVMLNREEVTNGIFRDSDGGH